MEGLLPLIHAGNGCDFHRIILPLKYLGIDLNQFRNKKITDLLKDCKILFFNRSCNKYMPFFIEERKKYGFKIIMDLDDYWVLNTNHILYNFWKINKIAEELVFNLRAADIVMCTTSLLADKIKQINQNVHIIPNALPFGHDQFNEEKEQSEFTRFIYTGGSSHFRDIQSLKIPFSKIINKPCFEKAQFILCGYDSSNAPTIKEWNKIESSFSLNGKLHNYVRRNTMSLDTYMEHYKYGDVSLVPLESNIFTAFKSNLKIIEAGCKFIPCITSNTPPYSLETNPKVIMYAHNAATWQHYLEYCVKNPIFVKEKGLELGQYVREKYDLFKINEYRKQLFEFLIK